MFDDAPNSEYNQTVFTTFNRPEQGLVVKDTDRTGGFGSTDKKKGDYMFTIFIDIDGVLNNEKDWKKPFTLNNKCITEFISLVNILSKRYKEIKIVLTSTWRNGFNPYDNNKNSSQIKNLISILKDNNIHITDKTPVGNNKTRQEEIEYYIKRNNIDKYIILDDDQSLFYNIDKINVYFTDYKLGLTKKDVTLIERKNKKWN